ncbi:MAG TPA: methyltransferase [Sediminibacterium sp.]|nr:methyltransferase [Sediminibacterium sp.]
MANPYFHFKNFSVYQDACAMKVCTDSCLFGAWVADYLQQYPPNNGNLLDIGTGTGLLALMLAQQIPAHIDAVEMDEAAAGQAVANFSASPWSARLRATHCSIQDFAANPALQYDFIISNPPFFENDLQSGQENRNLALHSKALKLSELIGGIKQLLQPEGRFAILIPFSRCTYFKAEAEKSGFYPLREVLVRQTTGHVFFRSMLIFGRQAAAGITEDLAIKDGPDYTEGFRKLLTPYYLPF